MSDRGAGDPLVALGEGAMTILGDVADKLIPAAHGMPSARAVVDADRVGFVLRARPDLAEPLTSSLRPELGEDPDRRLEVLGRDEPDSLAALQLTIVGGYYTDRRVRELIGYPGQLAIDLPTGIVPPYLEEGLIDAVVSRGPVWRDPATGTRAVIQGSAPQTYAERYWPTERQPEGGDHGGDSA